MEFEFGLRYKIGAGEDLSNLVDRLAQAGCDDAVVGIGRRGRLALQFAREGRSLEEAIISALGDVRKAAPSAHLIEVSTGLGPGFAFGDSREVRRQNPIDSDLPHVFEKAGGHCILDFVVIGHGIVNPVTKAT